MAVTASAIDDSTTTQAGAASAASGPAAASAAWLAFAAAPSQDEFLKRWLDLACQQVGGVRAALLLLAGDEPNTFHAGAVWPDTDPDLGYLAPVAQQALAERRGIVQAQAALPQPGARVAYPVEMAGALKAAIVLDLSPRAEAELQHALRQLHWATAWLLDLFRQQALQASAAVVARLSLVQSAVGAALQQAGFRAATLAALNQLALQMHCDRVSLGRDEGGDAVLEAISNTAQFDRRSNLARLIADAMDETLDAGVPVVHPAQGDARLLAASHAALAADAADTSTDADTAPGAAMSVPLTGAQGSFGVLTFERRHGPPFSADEQETCRVAGLLLGPVLALAHDNDRSPLRRARDGLVAGARALAGPRHPGARLFTAVGVLLLAVLALADGEHRVTARTVVEGATQRATVVPFDGYLAETLVRAGDTVKNGQLMARLDDRELKLELERWRAEHEQAQRKQRAAQAAYDRAATAVLSAQAAQAQAQLQLVQEKLARLQLRAPFDGVVVAGDLRQLVGTPVEQGKVLFETTPLDAYRVVLQVDERDIGHLVVGQPGELVLAGLPGVALAFTVAQITPVASAEEGRNVFRVEASVGAAAARLRPGMEGVGKVKVGERRLLWIWTHGFVDWLRLALWRWLP